MEKKCHSHEHGCGCCHHEEENMRMKIVRLIVCGILFIGGLFLPWKAVIFMAAYLIAGYDVLFTAIKNIGKGSLFDENLLMSVASIGAFLIGEYPEAAAVMLLYQLGEMLQDKALKNSRKSITELMDIRPDYANIVDGEEIKRVSPEEVKVGDMIVVNPGERIPLDGVVVKGCSYADYKALTGESKPVEIKVDDEVLSGAINSLSPIWIKVSKEYGESTVSKILELTENAYQRKAKSERFITSFAKVYTPIVVFSALALMIIPSFVSGEWSKWIYRGLVFLAVSCPCALVISVPLGFFAGIGGASKRGILVKGSSYIERLAKLQYVVFDKTGTLTEGEFDIININTKLDESEFIELCAMAEHYSSHPIAQSIKRNISIDVLRISDYKEIAGKGISASVDGKEILIGNAELVKNAPEIESDYTVVYVSQDGEYVGCIEIGDRLKAEAKEAVLALRKMNIKTAILSGDTYEAAKAIGNKLGIEEVYAQMLPQNKVKKIEELISGKAEGRFIAYSGDGINDAPVLAVSDVGISMGKIGSDSAVEASDVVLMRDEVTAIVNAVEISKKTMRIIKQNITLALGVKLLVMLLSVVGIANIWMAIFGDVGVALLAIVNSLRAEKI